MFVPQHIRAVTLRISIHVVIIMTAISVWNIIPVEAIGRPFRLSLFRLIFRMAKNPRIIARGTVINRARILLQLGTMNIRPMLSTLMRVSPNDHFANSETCLLRSCVLLSFSVMADLLIITVGLISFGG